MEEVKNVQELMGACGVPVHVAPFGPVFLVFKADSPSLVSGLAALLCPRACVASGVKESDTGLSKPNQWDLIADKMLLEKEQPLMVSCTL